jgi:hypothetical protein
VRLILSLPLKALDLIVAIDLMVAIEETNYDPMVYKRFSKTNRSVSANTALL